MRRVRCGMYQRRTSDSDICAENVPAGSIRKLPRSDPNQVRIPTLQDLRGFRKTSQAQEASRVEPRYWISSLVRLIKDLTRDFLLPCIRKSCQWQVFWLF